MVDLHCHILPGLDDGPATMEESMGMAESAIADGITHLVATPQLQQQILFLILRACASSEMSCKPRPATG